MKNLCMFLWVAVSLFGGAFNHAPKVHGDIEEKAIVVIIPSYNNARWYKKNLESIFMQKYSNYRVIYTNDASTDNTTQLVLDYVERCNQQGRFTFIDNKENKKPMYNTYKMIHSCADNEIVVTVDGDDWLLDDQVLDRVNRAYADERVWMTYGQDTNEYIRKGHSRATKLSILEEGAHRKMRWSWSHLRTFYAGLFKKVPEERWKKDGKFLTVGGDVAIILYLLDLAREHVFFIPDVLYYYNMDNPINDYKVNLSGQRAVRKYIWNCSPLARLHDKTDFID